MAANQKEILKSLNKQSLVFTGPNRVGRQATAKWYAKWLNCQNKAEDSCNSCSSCKQFEDDTHPDYFVLKPATTTASGKLSRKPEIKISQLVSRDSEEQALSQWLETSPVFNYRVAVIVDAEQMTISAANAFLKFLEEPPIKSKIILIAPSAQALLATIASRTSIIRFGTHQFPDANHPLARLGRIGDYRLSQEKPEEFKQAQELIDNYLGNINSSLEISLENADLLEKHWLEASDFDLAELFLAKLSKSYPQYYRRANLALEDFEESLARYGSSRISIQLLTLNLRAIFNSA